MIFFEMWVFELLSQEVYIFFGGSDEIDPFQMGQFLFDIFYLLDEIDIIFV